MDYPPETGFASPDLDFHSSETGPVSPDPNPDADLPANEIMDPDADLPANEIMAKAVLEYVYKFLQPEISLQKRPRWKGIPETCYDTDSRDLLQKWSSVGSRRRRASKVNKITIVSAAEEMEISFTCSCGKPHKVVHKFSQ